jgi:hypothetical protein
MEKDNFFPIDKVWRAEFEKYLQWDIKEALRAQKEWENNNVDKKDNGVFFNLTGPLHRFLAVSGLKELYEDWSITRDESALLEAIFYCAMYSLPLPAWCAKSFFIKFLKVKNYKAKSWDEVFGYPHKKSTNLCSKRKRLEKAYKVYQKIKKIKKENPSIPIDSQLFDQVGLEFNLGKTLTEKYYYFLKNNPDTYRWLMYEFSIIADLI